MGSIPGQGTKILHRTDGAAKKKTKKQLDEEEVYIFWRACEFDGSWFWKKNNY